MDDLLLRILAVITIFAGIIVSIAGSLVLITRLHLKSPVNLIASSIVIGLIFSLGSLGLIFLSEKFDHFSFIEKLVHAGEVGLLFFIGTLIFYLVKSGKGKQPQ